MLNEVFPEEIHTIFFKKYIIVCMHIYRTYHTYARLLAGVVVLGGLSVPFYAAASHQTTSAELTVAVVYPDTLVSVSGKPEISGAAIGVRGVRIEIRKEGSSKILYKSKTLKVREGEWRVRVAKKLPAGTYEVRVVTSQGRKTVLAEELLQIGSTNTQAPTAKTTLAVGAVPLLGGGAIRAGQSVPVSYLQVTNIGTQSATLKGFWLKQNGSAPATLIVGLTTVDDKGGSRGASGGSEGPTPFKNNSAFVPTATVTLAPGEMKLFTIKAILALSTASHLGKQIILEVTGVDTDASLTKTFPIRGTTWTIF